MKTIRNYQDLAEYFGCEDNQESVSRAIYKNTDCGAWLNFIDVDEDHPIIEKQKWVALLDPFTLSNEIRVHSVCAYKNKMEIQRDNWIFIKDAPEEVKLFLGINKNDVVDGFKNLEELKTRLESVDLNDFFVKLDKTVLYFQLPVKKPKHKLGIKVGSIVEGSDADCTPFTLFFPFTVKEFEKNIRYLEGEAKDLWHDANVYDLEE